MLATIAGSLQDEPGAAAVSVDGQIAWSALSASFESNAIVDHQATRTAIPGPGLRQLVGIGAVGCGSQTSSLAGPRRGEDESRAVWRTGAECLKVLTSTGRSTPSGCRHRCCSMASECQSILGG